MRYMCERISDARVDAENVQDREGWNIKDISQTCCGMFHCDELAALDMTLSKHRKGASQFKR